MATVHMDIDDHPHVRWLNQVQRPGLIKAPISGRVGGDGLTTSRRGPTSDQTRLGMPERATEYQNQSGPWANVGIETATFFGAKRRRIDYRTYQPFDNVPIDVIERILDQLPLLDLVRLRRINRSFNHLLRSPHLYHTLCIPASPAPAPELLALFPSLLPGTSDLTLRSFPFLALEPLLCSVTPYRLLHLDLSFSAVRNEQFEAMAEEGALASLRTLRLKGCRGVKDGAWLATALPKVETLDLSWSGVTSLPASVVGAVTPLVELENELLSTSPGSDDSVDSGYYSDLEVSSFFHCSSTKPRSSIWPRLQHLSLSSCPHLTVTTIEAFLESAIPPNLRTLDLSHLPLDHHTLAHLNLRPSDDSDPEPDSHPLETIDLRGILHSAVLESDDEVDVRRFVEWVAGMHARGGA
ncbi:BZ3500_MvSof-1268-A1-R1_Chr10-1g02753 [Microbotryum saponariae]|uniref:BZ3500_MvSof-1268-A1-R1_Chr10-1g02753 protein n=1 Tax=Microbotryum saponariae TaxID=289078 RepID=A0A2X0NF52_9BASI|nr:BZ3500_MvSof-1268-A1-R1_Chr10-1g02753 [Microbotryum saponariae]SDA06242.1 BZ3501_MvSof-1269-A2-R1_Chr10-1g02354 [Microbotryum saponariae]